MAKQAITNARRLNAFAMDPRDIVIVGRAKAVIDGHGDTKHPDRASHELWDPRALLSPDDEAIRRLARNMKARGFRSTISVSKDGDDVLVVDGRRRVIAARLASSWLEDEGLPALEVRCVVERVAEDGDLLALSRTLNAHRQDDDPVQKAKDIQALIGLNKSLEYIGDVYGESPAALKRLLSLLDVAAPVQHAVTAGKVSVEAAATLAKLPRDEQKTQLAELTAAAPKGGRVTLKATRSAVAAKQGREIGPTPRKPAELRAAIAAITDTTDDAQLVRDTLEWALGAHKTSVHLFIGEVGQ